MSDRGYTLAELLVALAVAGIVMSGLLSMLMAGQQSYLVGTNQIEAQQNLRIAIGRMIQEIRLAGEDPTKVNFDAITNQTATGLTIQNDWNANGAIQNAGTVGVTLNDGVTVVQRGEQVIYSLNGTTLMRQETGVDNAAQSVADGIQSLTFTYFKADGVTPAAVAADVRQVVIDIIAQPVHQPSTSAAGAVHIKMTDKVRLRNRGA
ncbi:MAG TPA: prepilin-type N-terminal cleavage/methylation domain-containing protein [Methylomirabilota bacterium]|jgi:type IV pilus assembly protein PilW